MARVLELSSAGPEQTRALGGVIASALRPGDVVSLTGELGAGKTCFVQGAAAALGVRERVTSPSFVLRRDYEGTIPVTHLDVYRLHTLQEVMELGFAEDPADRGVTFVEWGDAMQPLLPADHLEVELRLADASAPEESELRRVRLRAHGDAWARRLAELAGELQPWHVEQSC